MRSSISGGRGDDIVVCTVTGVLDIDASLDPENGKSPRAAWEKACESPQPGRWSLTENYFGWLLGGYEVQVSK